VTIISIIKVQYFTMFTIELVLVLFYFSNVRTAVFY